MRANYRARCVLVKEIGHADDVAHVVEPVNEAGFNLRKLVVHLVDGFEKLEFRVGGIEVRGVQDAASEALVLGLHEILVEPVCKIVTQGQNAGTQLVDDPVGKCPVIVGIFLDAVEDGRLDVRDDEPVEVVEETAFDDGFTQCALAGHVKIAGIEQEEEPCHDHLVRLLVDLDEFHGAEFVVPPLHECAGKNEFEQAFSDDD